MHLPIVPEFAKVAFLHLCQSTQLMEIVPCYQENYESELSERKSSVGVLQMVGVDKPIFGIKPFYSDSP